MGIESVGYTDDGFIFMTIKVKDGDREGMVVSKMTPSQAKQTIGWLETALENVPIGGEVVLQ